MSVILNEYGAANTETADKFTQDAMAFADRMITKAHCLKLDRVDMRLLEQLLEDTIHCEFGSERIRTAIDMRHAQYDAKREQIRQAHEEWRGKKDG